MKHSAKTKYAAIAVLELARQRSAAEPVRIRDIAAAHGIPSRFLVQILLQLKTAGLVGSTRGAGGGYQLLCDPAEITLEDVVRVFEGPGDGAAAPPAPRAGRPRMQATLRDAWRDVAEAEATALRSITFADLMERSRAAGEAMYYI
jgi:Rrf2 family protein